MAENAHEQVLGFLSDRQQAARNELSAARIELEGAQNRVATAEEYLNQVDEQVAHHKTKGA
jgi:predicted  nucleic acid-binding Zn-ribbon protein